MKLIGQAILIIATIALIAAGTWLTLPAGVMGR